MKIIISLLLALISVTAFAQKAQTIANKTDGHVTPSQKKLITNTFFYLNKFWADQGKSLSRKETQKYFTPDTTLIINGKTIYTGYAQFGSHFNKVSKIIRGKIHFPLLELMTVDNKLIVYFNEDIEDNNGNHYPSNVIAIFTLHQGKIQRWEQVANSNYFCQAGAEKTVYSH